MLQLCRRQTLCWFPQNCCGVYMARTAGFAVCTPCSRTTIALAFVMTKAAQNSVGSRLAQGSGSDMHITPLVQHKSAIPLGCRQLMVPLTSAIRPPLPVRSGRLCRQHTLPPCCRDASGAATFADAIVPALPPAHAAAVLPLCLWCRQSCQCYKASTAATSYHRCAAAMPLAPPLLPVQSSQLEWRQLTTAVLPLRLWRQHCCWCGQAT